MYVINLDELKSIGTDWIALYLYGNNVAYFDSFGVEFIPKETRKFIGTKNIIANIYKIQAYDLMLCRYFCIEFIDFKLSGKSLTSFTNIFSPHDF